MTDETATMGQVAEAAIMAGVKEATARVVVRKLHSAEMQKLIDERLRAIVLEVVDEPSFKDEVRRRLLRALTAMEDR